MGKHLDWKTKYNYVMRYLNGESATQLGKELIRLGLVKSKDNKVGSVRIYVWTNKYFKNGVEDLKSKSGLLSTGRPPKKKKKPKPKDPNKWDDFTKEELVRIIEIYEDLINEDKRDTKRKFNAIYHETIIPKYKMCKALNVSKSGYYDWIKNGMNLNFKYDQKLLKLISKIFYDKNQVFGFRRIHIELERKYNIKVNVNTVYRYYKYLNFKSKIRQKRKKHRIKKSSI